MKMKSFEATDRHKRCRDEMLAALRKHDDLPANEMLAIAAQLVGQLIALQDQRKYTPEMALAIVEANIKVGNDAALETVKSAGGTKQ